MMDGFSFGNFGAYRPGATGLTATGSTQADAAPLLAAVNLFTSVPPGAGCQLPQVQSSNTLEVVVLNRDPANGLAVYPPVQGQIETLGVNAPYVLQPGTSALFQCFDPPMAPGQHWNAVLELGTATPQPPTAFIGPTPPTGVSPGWLWWNTTDGNTYVWYDDGNGAPQWVPAVANTGTPGPVMNMPNLPLAQSDGSPPVGAAHGDLYNNGGFVCVTP